jgi:uncharacterized protein YkwD
MLGARQTKGTGLNFTRMHSGAAVFLVLTVAPLQAQRQDLLVQLINDYRAAPGNCKGGNIGPVPPLVAHPVLSRLTIGPGTLLEPLLERAGYPVGHAEAISVTGAPDAAGALKAIISKNCKVLLNPDFVTAGSSNTGDNWLLVLAQPAIARTLPDAASAGALVLAAVNAARAQPRRCGNDAFDAVPPLAWNAALEQAAQGHSSDMANQRYFNHTGKDGRTVGERASAAGYRWQSIGENIAAGQDSAQEAVAGWLDSPGHCVNIMSRKFTEMGAAFDLSGAQKNGRVYWTQVLGAPR